MIHLNVSTHHSVKYVLKCSYIHTHSHIFSSQALLHLNNLINGSHFQSVVVRNGWECLGLGEVTVQNLGLSFRQGHLHNMFTALVINK